MKKILLTFLLLAVCATGFADELPQFIENGFSRYKAGSTSGAMRMWMKDSILSDSLEAEFSQDVKPYGKMDSYEVLYSIPVSKKLKRIYCVVYLENSPLFLLFDIYKKGDNWVVYSFEYDNELTAIIPQEFISPTGLER